MAAPTPGRIVHFIARDKKHLPAIVVEGHEDGSADLGVFGCEGHAVSYMKRAPNIEPDPRSEVLPLPIGSWHWPEQFPSVAPKKVPKAEAPA